MYKCVSFPLPLMQVSCIHFSTKRQKNKLAELIIGLLSRRKQGGTEKILYELKPLFPIYARKPLQSRSISLVTISAMMGSLNPSEKLCLLWYGLPVPEGMPFGKGMAKPITATGNGKSGDGVRLTGSGLAGPLRRTAVCRRCSAIMSSARSKRGISVLLTPSPLPAGLAAPGIMSFARKISGLWGVLYSSACLSFSAICQISCPCYFIYLNIRAGVIQAGSAKGE
jgi:hypothetical protein